MRTSISDLLTVASIIAGFGVTTLMFRIQRELYMEEKGELTWITWADGLMILSTLIALLVVVLPIILLGAEGSIMMALEAGATSGAVILLAGYVPSILAHYRFFAPEGPPRMNPEPLKHMNPEPLERKFVLATLAAAVIGAAATFFCNIRIAH